MKVSGSLVGDGTCGQTTGDAKLGPLENNECFRLSNSTGAANGIGDSTYCDDYGTDQAGQTRPTTNCDAGSVEYLLTSANETATATQWTATPTPTPTPTLRAAEIRQAADAAVRATERKRQRDNLQRYRETATKQAQIAATATMRVLLPSNAEKLNEQG